MKEGDFMYPKKTKEEWMALDRAGKMQYHMLIFKNGDNKEFQNIHDNWMSEAEKVMCQKMGYDPETGLMKKKKKK